MKPLVQVMRKLGSIPVFVACLSLFALMIMTFCDVLFRSILNDPIEAGTELTRIFMAVLVFAVLPIVSAQSEHIAVDLTDGLFDRLGLSRLRDGLMNIVCGVLLIWPAMQVHRLAERAREYGDVTEYLGLPQFYIGWFIAVMVALTAIAMVFMGALTLFFPSLLREHDFHIEEHEA